MTHTRNRILAVVLVVLFALGVGFVAFEAYVFDQLAVVDPTDNNNLTNRPDDFQLYGYEEFPNFDTSPYEMPEYEDVFLPSRTVGVILAGWYIPGDPDAPGIIVTHGLRGCTCEANMLVPAGMLHRNGFNVLLIDLRNHGRSTIVNRHAAFGNSEHLDVLAAWDWLATEKDIEPSRIGLFGGSMGAATSLIALAEEPAVAAAFVDSPFYTVQELLGDQLALRGYPRWLAAPALWTGGLVWGDDLFAHRPGDAFVKDAGRPLYVVHGTKDERIGLHHRQQYAALAASSGANVTLWVVEGAGHVQSSFLISDEYERRLTSFFQEALSE